MPTLPESLLEIREHNGPDYKPLIDYQSWRVALMNYMPDLVPEKTRNRFSGRSGITAAN